MPATSTAPELYTCEMFESAFDGLYRHLKRAMELDDQELRNAVRRLVKPRDWNEAETRRTWAKVQQDAHQAWSDLLLTYRNHFAPTVEVPQQLIAHKIPVWRRTAARLQAVEQQMRGLTVEEAWQGESAVAYRSLLPKHAQQLQQSIAIADNAALSVSAVALIQATIDQALFSTLLTYFTGMYDRVNRRPRTKWRNGLFRRLTKGKNRDQYKHEFFERTIYATERFQELTRYILAICDPGSAEWASAARGISMTLDTVNQVTEAGYVSGVAEYDGTANVGTRQAGTSSHGHKMKR